MTDDERKELSVRMSRHRTPMERGAARRDVERGRTYPEHRKRSANHAGSKALRER